MRPIAVYFWLGILNLQACASGNSASAPGGVDGSHSALPSFTTSELIQSVVSAPPSERLKNWALIKSWSYQKYYDRVTSFSSDAPFVLDGRVIEGVRSQLLAQRNEQLATMASSQTLEQLADQAGFNPATVSRKQLTSLAAEADKPASLLLDDPYQITPLTYEADYSKPSARDYQRAGVGLPEFADAYGKFTTACAKAVAARDNLAHVKVAIPGTTDRFISTSAASQGGLSGGPQLMASGVIGWRLTDAKGVMVPTGSLAPPIKQVVVPPTPAAQPADCKSLMDMDF